MITTVSTHHFVKQLTRGILTLSLLAAASSLSWATEEVSPEALTPDADRIKAHLHFLADDLLEGRETGSRGHEIASLYIATELAKYGLTPAGTDAQAQGMSAYMQRVEFRHATLVQESPKMAIIGPEGSQTLDYPKQFIMGPDLISTESNVEAKLIFVGYGITAPLLEHDDYAGLDVDGKIVVALSGKPQHFPSEEGAHFASGSQKQRYAAQNGAVGMITIVTPQSEKVRPYQNSLNYLHTPAMRWLKENGEPANVQKSLIGSAYLPMDSAELLFEGAQRSLDDIYTELESDGSPAGFDLPYTVALSRESEHKTITSPNVAAILEGSDPELKNEYVVYSAHSDHIGFAKTVKKDKINNGAMDNASGTSVMLETARLFSQMDTKPKRSILFVAVTGEEKGLLGADYYARNPTVPKGSMVANVNLDMPILTYEFADVIAFGANHSDMQASVDDAAQKVGIELSPDPWPEQALFTRSDHYSFVKQGVPAVFLVPGLKASDPDVDGSEVFGHFISTHYHKPSDDLNQDFNWQAATKFTAVNVQIGLTLANQAERTRWNEGDFFGDTFAPE
ncbi:M28 family metallopeptidase [Alteromonas oceanisediminis]|uniref:M28 family metallopeptidase n=1 Tax=Alteromonas oceanisediminis TaxID=2836180 RepID=UPI001BD93582|nr:M28 family metallopeptidase [Alteromonas oceanisediminis]MBT0586740.1 M28 family peptidase [Alteromonas oceanisediminis]